ncbi:MAG: SGNH/GDSL hydrolase family protein [Sedimenticola sp.]
MIGLLFTVIGLFALLVSVYADTFEHNCCTHCPLPVYMLVVYEGIFITTMAFHLEGTPTIAIFGDSHVRRLEEQVLGRLSIHPCVTKFIGFDGLTAGDDTPRAIGMREEAMKELLSCQADFVVVSVGGNDICPEFGARQVFRRIWALVTRIKQTGAVVYVTGIIPRLDVSKGRGIQRTSYEKIRRAASTMLKERLKGHYIPLPFHLQSDLGKDGVHLTVSGALKFSAQIESILCRDRPEWVLHY